MESATVPWVLSLTQRDRLVISKLSCRRPVVPKPDLVQIERILNDAGGGHSDAQDVLLGGQVGGGRHPIYLH